MIFKSFIFSKIFVLIFLFNSIFFFVKIISKNLFDDDFISLQLAGGPVRTLLVLDDESCPAELQACYPRGATRFSVQMRRGGLVRVHDSVLMPNVRLFYCPHFFHFPFLRSAHFFYDFFLANFCWILFAAWLLFFWWNVMLIKIKNVLSLTSCQEFVLVE